VVHGLQPWSEVNRATLGLWYCLQNSKPEYWGIITAIWALLRLKAFSWAVMVCTGTIYMAGKQLALEAI